MSRPTVSKINGGTSVEGSLIAETTTVLQVRHGTGRRSPHPNNSRLPTTIARTIPADRIICLI
jgi:hypothetical protein